MILKISMIYESQGRFHGTKIRLIEKCLGPSLYFRVISKPLLIRNYVVDSKTLRSQTFLIGVLVLSLYVATPCDSHA